MKVAANGDISLSDNTATGLVFANRTGGTIRTEEATITGRLKAGTAGTFNLTYTVVDGDRNVKGECTSANTPPDCDTATVDVTLMVAVPKLTLTANAGDVKNNDGVLLLQDVALDTAMTLPTEAKMSDVSGSANISRELKAYLALDSSGSTGKTAEDALVVGEGSAQSDGLTYLPGLIYTAATGTLADESLVAGTLTGTPTAEAAGTWVLIYTVTDNNDTPDDTADDLVQKIVFAVRVEAASVPDLADVREGELSGKTFNYLVGDTVGTSSNMGFLMPVVTGGNRGVTESLGRIAHPPAAAM